MNKLIQVGRIMFALGLIGLGILQFIHKDFVVGRPDAWPAGLQGKVVWVYLSAVLLIGAGICFLLKKFTAQATILIGLIVLIYSFFLRHFAGMISNTPEGILWSVNAFKTLAICASIFIVGAAISDERNQASLIIRSNFVQWVSLIFLSYFFILCGFSHFKFFEFVNTLVPSYFPSHGVWTTIAGLALMATGLGILSPYSRRPAALAAGVMLLLWFFLVHIPRATSSHDNFEWMGVFESFSLSAALFVLAGISSNRDTAFARI